MTIREITKQADWDPFLAQLQPNTFLQSWAWGEVQRQQGETVRFLGLFNNDQQVGAALAMTVKARRGNYILIPHGPLFSSKENAHTYLPELIAHLKTVAQQDKAVAIRVAPLAIDNPDSRQLFASLGFKPAPLHIHAELTWVLDISKSVEELLAGMRKTTRHAIKKAEEVGVNVAILIDPSALNRFWPLYQSTTTRHHFIAFQKDFIQQQLQEFAKGNHMFIAIATHQNRDVAGAILFQSGHTVFYYHGASKKLNAAIPAAQLLQWAAIKEAKQRGATRYNFWGIAPDKEPKHPFAGITVFKKGFGGEAINYLHAQDLPTSPSYIKLWLVEMFRKFKRGF